MFESASREEATAIILDQVKAYYQTFMQKPPYREGDRIPYASRVFDEHEMMSLVDSALEFWLTAGRYTDRFEKQLADYLRVPYCSLVNSGSSANLLAFMALTSPLLGERAIRRGQTRMLFAGNLTRHPCFDELRKSGEGYRVAGSLATTDRIMRDVFWIGVYPGMSDEMIDAMIKAVEEGLRL